MAAAAVVVVLALEGDEQDAPVLYVRSLQPAQTVVVPYLPDMRLWEYLRTILGPRAGAGGVSPDGNTVYDTFISNTNATGAPVVFNRSNRLRRLGDLVQPDAILHHAGIGGARDNATRSDVAEPCSICLEKDTDFQLPNCVHAFHARCIGAYAQTLRHGGEVPCPLCRAPISK